MKRIILMVCVVLLAGCAPSLLGSKRDSQYQGQISRVAIVISGRSFDESSGYGQSPQAVEIAKNTANHAVSSLRILLPESLPKSFQAHGVPASLGEDMIGGTNEGASHLLTIYPTSASSLCSYGRCSSSARLNAVLTDMKTNASVWSADLEVPMPPAVRPVSEGRGNAEIVSELIIQSLQKDGLVRSVK